MINRQQGYNRERKRKKRTQWLGRRRKREKKMAGGRETREGGKQKMISTLLARQEDKQPKAPHHTLTHSFGGQWPYYRRETNAGCPDDMTWTWLLYTSRILSTVPRVGGCEKVRVIRAVKGK
jgi:hypothetical protein